MMHHYLQPINALSLLLHQQLQIILDHNTTNIEWYKSAAGEQANTNGKNYATGYGHGHGDMVMVMVNVMAMVMVTWLW